jgi:hypothetical protein
MTKEKNIAFIDAQNLHLWTQTEKWKVDFKRFRIYLKDKFNKDLKKNFFQIKSFPHFIERFNQNID